jgi:hypothetical protein
MHSTGGTLGNTRRPPGSRVHAAVLGNGFAAYAWITTPCISCQHRLVMSSSARLNPGECRSRQRLACLPAGSHITSIGSTTGIGSPCSKATNWVIEAMRTHRAGRRSTASIHRRRPSAPRTRPHPFLPFLHLPIELASFDHMAVSTWTVDLPPCDQLRRAAASPRH